MRDKGVAIFSRRELRLLDFLNIMLHALALGVSVRQIKHVEPHTVDTRQGDELILVTHIRQLLLEAGDGFIIQLFLPVKRRRAVVGQQFTRIFRVNRIGKALRQLKVRGGSFTPHQVGIGRVGQPAADRLFDTGMGAEETFAGTVSGDELTIVRIAV